MRIDGREIAKAIFEDLKKRVEELKKKGVTPHLVVILVGEDPASKTYVHQKELKAQEIGAKTTVYRLPLTINQQQLLSTIEQLNNDSNVNGIIVQRPLPVQIDGNAISLATNPQKDIDAFHQQTPFTMPLAAAVLRILEKIHSSTSGVEAQKFQGFIQWLKSKNIVVMGKGETGGGPVITNLRTLGVKPLIIDSKTQEPDKLVETADILISTVGKQNAYLPQHLKRGVILVIVGMYRGSDGKLHGDYEEQNIKDIASFYTPVPGGVGPVNVAMLLANLVRAAEDFR